MKAQSNKVVGFWHYGVILTYMSVIAAVVGICFSVGGNVFIKGRLHTVQPAALEKRRVFCENCREYTVMNTENFGTVTQIEVGAMMIGRIVNNGGAGNFTRGGEKGKFEFGGSTIILLIEKDRAILDDEFFENTRKDLETAVKCGERIGEKYSI